MFAIPIGDTLSAFFFKIWQI